ncbi:MAG: cephalosporin hydroxylase family protein [Acidobacteriota bacterium]|nr:cephalosporin hydroxylase family protein [Acidobacteriota bacterium]
MITEANGETRSLPLYSDEAFAAISHIWIKAGWALKFSYNFCWMGRPIIQLPEDLLRIQEAIYSVRPDIIIETGVAHGGSAVFYASLFETLGTGRVISIDIEIRPHNRKAIEEHPLKKRITLIEGSSTDAAVVEQVRGLIGKGDKAMVVLDSNHTKAHVLQELKAYAPMVSPGSYIIATDGIMRDLHDVPGGKPEWTTDNPAEAVHEFLKSCPEFEIDQRPGQHGVTYWPDAYLRRK